MKRRLFLFSVITIMLFLCSCFDNGCKGIVGYNEGIFEADVIE